MIEKNLNYETARNPKVLKNPKGYDRARDRKNKQLFEYENENKEYEAEQDAKKVFYHSARNE